MLYLGLGAIVFVPIFKTVTHLPPYVGMMLSLAIVATFAEIFSRKKFSMTSLMMKNLRHMRIIVQFIVHCQKLRCQVFYFS